MWPVPHCRNAACAPCSTASCVHDMEGLGEELVGYDETVQSMSKETQFVVITHNKITMAAASRLYGVTMQERGVSKLVSVELDDVQPLPEAAAASA